MQKPLMNGFLGATFSISGFIKIAYIIYTLSSKIGLNGIKRIVSVGLSLATFFL